MVEINIHFEQSRWGEMTTAGQMAFEDYADGVEPSRRGLCELIAPFMQDGRGNWLDHKAAMRVLGRIQNKDVLSLVEQFSQALADYTVPKESGNNSTSSPKTDTEAQPGSTI